MQFFQNTKQYSNRYLNIKASLAYMENWCDPRHLQGSQTLLWHAKVGVFSLTVYIDKTETFYFFNDWLLSSKFLLRPLEPLSALTLAWKQIKSVCVGGGVYKQAPHP